MKEEKKNRISSKMLIYIFSFICLILIVLTYYSSRFIAPIRQTLAYVVSPLQSGVNDMGLWTYNKSEQLKDAKKLMEDSSLHIADISERVGFADTAHFSRVFKKYTGMSAGEYRNKYLR